MSPGNVALGEFVPERLEEVEAVEHPVPPFREEQRREDYALRPGLPGRDHAFEVDGQGHAKHPWLYGQPRGVDERPGEDGPAGQLRAVPAVEERLPCPVDPGRPGEP